VSFDGNGRTAGGSGAWPWLMALAGGALHAWALSPWCAQWASWAPALAQTVALLCLIQALLGAGHRPGRAAGLAWLYGCVWLVGATGWMYVSLHRYGGLPAWLSAAAVLALCGALSLYMAALGAVWVRWRRGHWWRDALLFGALWGLAEMARALVFTGFPWGASGYGLIDTPWDKLAPWLGVYGIGMLWAMVVMVFGQGLRCSRPQGGGVPRAGLLVVLVLCVAGALVPPWHFTQAHGQPLSVTLLQSNVPQDEKFVVERQLPVLRWHMAQLTSARGDLVVAPETAIPYLPAQLPAAFWAELRAPFGDGSRHAALFGVPLGDEEAGYTNSVMGLSARAEASKAGYYRYDKHHLVPFGEFIPLGFHWFVKMMNMPLGDFSRGPLVAPPFEVKGQRVAPNICYEDLFGEEIAARFAQPAQAPTILVNVSNLAWFGESVAIHQHLQIARMRSLEFQVPSLRATNTGATVVIDAQGRVTAALPPNTRGVLQATVQGRSGVTPFAWWAGRWGLWPLLAVAVLLVLVGASGPRIPD